MVRHRRQLRRDDPRVARPGSWIRGTRWRGGVSRWCGSAAGTGKSYALGALAYQWREHASFHYIADPFLGDVGYLLEFIVARPRGDKEWRVTVLEDTGELFSSDARRQTGL